MLSIKNKVYLINLLIFLIITIFNGCTNIVNNLNDNKCKYKSAKGKIFLKDYNKKERISYINFYPEKNPFASWKLKKNLYDIKVSSGYNIQTENKKTFTYYNAILKKKISGNCEKYIIKLDNKLKPTKKNNFLIENN